MRVANQDRRDSLENSLNEYLENCSKNGELPLLNGRLSRTEIRKAIGCSVNWLAQNAFAAKTLKEWDSKLHAEGVTYEPRATPSKRNESTELLKKQVDRLQKRNAQLMAEVSELKRRLSAYEWIGSTDNTTGRLPW